MVKIESKKLTLTEFLQQPETKPAREYIDGKIIQKPMPQGKHSAIQGELVTAINQVLKPAKVARAFPELRCTFGQRSIVPDIVVLTWSQIPRDEQGEIANTITVAPTWTIEILSPDQSQTKVIKNILYCLKNGTQMGWLIDPNEKTIFVYRPQQETEVFEESDMIIPVPNWAQNLQLTLADIFAWLRN